jgi:hypothetical protein
MERTKVGLLLAKRETTYGVDAAPVATANAIAVIRNQVTFSPEFDPVRREILDGGFGRVAGENVLPRVKLSFSVELRGNRTNGSAADISSGNIANLVELDPLLQACDLNPTYTAETSGGARDGNVTYRPRIPTDEGIGCTFYFYSEKKLHKVLGAKGNVKGVFEAGKFPVLNFEFMGLYVAITDAGLPSPITWLDTKPPLFVNSGSTIDAYNPVFKKFEFDLGNQIHRRDDANAGDGVRGFIVTGRESTASINPESVTEAIHPVWADLKSGKVKTLTAKAGNQSGNRIDVITTVQKRQVGYEDDNNTRLTNWQVDIVRSALSGGLGTEFQLKFF